MDWKWSWERNLLYKFDKNNKIQNCPITMILFFGLGNNEQKYLQTKHNAGRIVLETLASSENLEWKNGQKYHYTKSKWNGEDICFLYSSGYMNNSGDALQSFISYFKIDTADQNFRLFILQDDSDQISGSQKLVTAGGSGGHNGIIDIYQHLLSCKIDINSVWRLKIGIRQQNNTQKSMDFVLKSLSEEEFEYLPKLSKKLLDNKDAISELNFEKLQERVNTKN